MGIPYTSSDRGATGKLRSAGLSIAVIDEASLYVQAARERQHLVRKLGPILPQFAVLQLQLFDLLARFCERFVLVIAHLNN